LLEEISLVLHANEMETNITIKHLCRSYKYCNKFYMNQLHNAKTSAYKPIYGVLCLSV